MGKADADYAVQSVNGERAGAPVADCVLRVYRRGGWFGQKAVDVESTGNGRLQPAEQDLTPLGPRPSVLRDLCWQPIVFLGPFAPFRSTETLRERREVDGSNS